QIRYPTGIAPPRPTDTLSVRRLLGIRQADAVMTFQDLQPAPSEARARLDRVPLLSVVIPTYNRALRLPLALQSVVDAALDPVEIVVVDDGSTDNTAEVVERFGRGVRYVRQGNAGPAAARNRGIREARGDYILFLDSDDRLLPRVHRPLVEFL